MSADAPYAPHDPYAALRHANYRRFLIGTFLANMGRQMTTVAVAWQIYQWTKSATALGLVGLLNVLPLLACSLPAGVLADRFDRRRILKITTSATVGLSALLAGLAWFHDRVPRLGALEAANAGLLKVALFFERQADPASLNFTDPALPLVYLILFAMGTARILGWPARSALVPQLVPPAVLGNTMTWNSSAFEISTMAGPALGGFVIAWAGFPAVYALDALAGLALVAALARVEVLEGAGVAVAEAGRRSWRSVLAGAEFIWSRKVILGASALDMFAVLLGGAVALLPIYAEEILHVGPIGLGWLRAAPSIGAFLMAMWIAHRRPMRRPGLMLLWAVAGFGAAAVVFGVSSWFALSFAALFAMGVCDNVSVVVRQSLVQLLTPNHLRGRVTSVNQIFVGSSNEIGTLRAGLTAAAIGPVGAAVLGGVGTIVTTWVVARAVPQLKDVAPLDQLKAE